MISSIIPVSASETIGNLNVSKSTLVYGEDGNISSLDQNIQVSSEKKFLH